MEFLWAHGKINWAFHLPSMSGFPFHFFSLFFFFYSHGSKSDSQFSVARRSDKRSTCSSSFARVFHAKRSMYVEAKKIQSVHENVWMCEGVSCAVPEGNREASSVVAIHKTRSVNSYTILWKHFDHLFCHIHIINVYMYMCV